MVGQRIVKWWAKRQAKRKGKERLRKFKNRLKGKK